ncbi:lysine-specific demethylase 5A-like [Watersipora subatra]|uniref:lysine-specific demethylase 5A-like n=1 Tax=Watersipora subatra TaxID=2589382 RepID=UPI00355C3764
MVEDDHIKFIQPPEAPIFTPTEEEFEDPISYIANVVKPVIDKTGICKIQPPSDWRPSFAIDVENFRFQPRVQRINELEATTRVKLNFLRKLTKFWELQGAVLKVPLVNRAPLDLYKLQKLVQVAGGYEAVTDREKWSRIAIKMDLPDLPNKCYGSILKSHYAKYLYPYEHFEGNLSCSSKVSEKVLDNKPAAPLKSPKKEPDIDYNTNSEMRKLQFYGAGYKAALPTTIKAGEKGENDRCMRDRTKASYLESDICRTCGLTENEEEMLTCCNCDEVYHKYCLFPRVEGIVKGLWRCPKCVAKEYKKPADVFGFDTAPDFYCLASFGAMADKFKENYFQKSIGEVSCAEVEEEFWKLTSNINETVTVHYGADIHALTNGSGFPTKLSDRPTFEEEKYVKSKWNLNRLPVDEGSVLRFVSGDVSGMKVPWCYVGMCFSCFCWHIEDHWSYSINFHHWGEPKTWYGVPSSHADTLEEVMKGRAPELFEQSPDLLHHITTIMNPNMLMANNVPVVRTDQCAGEFIITAPRAFHAGFNQGYNFAEAVNFCPADWLPMGRACISNYKKVKRNCVFSHEELICKMAADAQSLSLQVALEAHKELLILVDQERRLRKKLLEHGITQAAREKFEMKADDERQCCYCKTTCFLSAIVCQCRAGAIVCLEHASELCHCPGSKKCLLFRYTLDELPAMIRGLGSRVSGFQKWKTAAKKAYSAKGTDRLTLVELKSLLSEGKEAGYQQHTSLYGNLQRAAKETERYSSLVRETCNRRVRVRRTTDQLAKSVAKRLSLSEVVSLVEQLQDLICQIKDADMLQDLVSKAQQFMEDTRSALLKSPSNLQALIDLQDVGISLDLDLPEIGDLNRAIEQGKWLKEVSDVLEREEDELATVEELESLVTRGNAFSPHPEIEKVLTEMNQILTVGQSWEDKATVCLQANPKHTLSAIEALLSESEGVKVYLSNMEALREQTQRSMDWIGKAESLLKSIPHPALEQLKNHASKARTLPVRLDLLDKVNVVIEEASDWKHVACKHFVKYQSEANLLEVLLPRFTNMFLPKRHLQKKQQRVLKEEKFDSNSLIDNAFSTTDMYEKAAQAELANVADLRLSSDPTTQLCVCGVKSAAKMFMCVVCKHWQHYKCSDLSRNQNERSEVEGFVCSECVRSKRPKLKVILQLLVSLRKIPARFLEGEALQSLTERALKWQEQTKCFLGRTTFSSLCKKFTALKSKNLYWAEQEDDEPVKSPFLDHDYITSSVILPKKEHPTFDIPDLEPDDEFCETLDALLLEGRLLEVTMDELPVLDKFKFTLTRYKLDGLAVPRKQRRKPPVRESLMQEPVITSTTGEVMSELSRKRKTRSSKGAKKRKKAPNEPKSSVEEDEAVEEEQWGDYDELCAAANGCLKPDDESLCWVQCGSCEKWFHLACIGVLTKQLTDDDYTCDSCKPPVDGLSSPDADKELSAFDKEFDNRVADHFGFSDSVNVDRYSTDYILCEDRSINSTDLSDGKQLEDALDKYSIIEGKIHSLDGIHQSMSMECT